MTVGTVAGETVSADDLFDAVQQGMGLFQTVTTLEEEADLKLIVARESVGWYDVVGIPDSEYPGLADMSVNALMSLARAKKNREHFNDLEESARTKFTGRAVVLRSVVKDGQAITAYYRPLTPGSEERIRGLNMLTKPHPEKAKGSLSGLSFINGTVEVRPGFLSPYVHDRGFLRARLFDNQGNRAVSIELADPA